jgi:acylglycerol lipase
MPCCPCISGSAPLSLSTPLLPKSCPEKARRRWLKLPDDVKPQASLFLFHGTHEHCSRYHEFASLCNYDGIRVYSLDFHGHGQREEGRRGDFGTMADAVAEAVDLVTSELASMAGPPGRIIIMGHSLGSMVAYLAAHELASQEHLPTPHMCILSGFAMDSVSPPFGIHALTPILKAMPEVIHKAVGCLSAVSPHGPACPLPPPSGLTRDTAEVVKMLADPLRFNGWIQNRTALALLDARKWCDELLPEWGRAFPFLMVHGGDDLLCPVSACERLMASATQPDKELRVFEGCLHEVLFAERATRAKVHAHILSWISARL